VLGVSKDIVVPGSSRWHRSPTGSTAIWRGAGARVAWFGQMLDPIADKLSPRRRSSRWCARPRARVMVALIIGREFAVTALRSLAPPRASFRRRRWAPRWRQVTAICCVPWRPGCRPADPGTSCVGGDGVGVVSVNYYRRFQRMLNAHVTVGGIAGGAAG
jgi:hypothetical protein